MSLASARVFPNRQNPDWIRLQVEEIQRLILVLQLKHWWVAEFSGVHKTTLRRWLQGKIRHVRKPRAQALAALLGVELRQISSTDNAVH